MQSRSSESRAIFAQLRAEPRAAVRSVIENHDAWLHSASVQAEIDATITRRLAGQPRLAAVAQRIAEQRQALAALVVRMPAHVGKAS